MSRNEKMLKCPVCGAKFRGTITCTRCGGDLGPLMRIAARARHLRIRAVSALKRGELDAALVDIRRSRRLLNNPTIQKTELMLRLIRILQPPSGDSRRPAENEATGVPPDHSE